MEAKLTSLYEQQQQRLALLRELNAALEQAQGAVVASDLNKIEFYTARQQALCEALCAAEDDPATQHQKTADALEFPEAMKERWNTLSQEIVEVAERVRQLNRVHAALLRRSRQTVGIFIRLLANPSIPYASPLNQAAVASDGMRK